MKPHKRPRWWRRKPTVYVVERMQVIDGGWVVLTFAPEKGESSAVPALTYWYREPIDTSRWGGVLTDKDGTHHAVESP